MINSHFTQQLARIRYTRNSLGSNTASSSVNFNCRIEPTTVKTAGSNGEYHSRTYRIYVAAGSDIQVNDRIVFFETGVYGSADEWTVKSVFVARGRSVSHLEVYV
jgi:hypothetical protein